MSELIFAASGWLWLLPAAGLAGYILIRRHRRIGLLQAAMLLLLILAASQPFWRYGSREKKQLLLIEPGMTAAALPEPYCHWETQEYSGSPAQALSRAAAALPERGGTIAIAGELIEPDHSLEARLETIRVRGIAVKALAAPGRGATAPALRSLSYPPRAGVGATVPLRLLVESAVEREVAVTLKSPEGAVLLRQMATLQPGSREITVEWNLAETGLQQAEVWLDDLPCATVAVAVAASFEARLLSADFEREAALLLPVFGNALKLRPWREDEKLDRVPLLLLGEGAAAALSPERQREVVEFVRAGGGVLAEAGRNAVFDPEEVLPEFAGLFPVTYEGIRENKLPTVALVVIIDTSGSMRGARIDLARETARLALENLRENDLAGIVEFHGTRRWAAPLQSAANQFSLMRALNRLNAGGGTVILPALEESYYVLRNAATRLKHVLILTDGGVEYGDFESVIRKMVRDDITVSTVMVGPGESDFLSRLALWGNGRFFRASSRFALPDLQLRPQGRKPLPPYVEDELPLRYRPHWLLEHLAGDAAVAGVVRSTLAEDAQLLVSAGEFPLLAEKRSELGRVAVWNSQLNGEWTAALGRDPAFPALLTALARSLPDELAFDGIRAWNRSANRDLDFEFETAEARSALHLTLSAAGKKLGNWEVGASEQGSFRFRLPDLPEGIYMIHSDDYDIAYPFVSRRAPEYSPVAPETRAAQINASIHEESSEPVTAKLALAPWLALAAAGCFVGQLAWRRLTGIVALALLGFCVMADEFEEYMREAIRCHEAGEFAAAAGRFEQAGASAGNDEDRDFAALLARENARLAGTLPEALREWIRAEVAPEPALQAEIKSALLAGRRDQAGELYQREIAAATDPAWLEQIASAAERQAFYGVSEAALRKILQLTGNTDWPTYFRLVRLYCNSGRAGEAVALLEALAGSGDAAALLTAGDLSEQLGHYETALKLYRASGLEDATMRIAALAAQQGDISAALAAWETLIATSPTEMRALQAIEQWTEALRRSGQLEAHCEKLARELPETPMERQIQWYARALAAAGKSEELFAFLNQHRQTALLLRYLLELRHYPQAVELLRREALQNPERAVECHRQLAMIAIESKNLPLATESLAALQSLPKDSAEFAGAVYALLGDHAAAATCFAEALQAAPQKTELLLLWAREKNAMGEGAEALALFQRELPLETAPERFGILVDGLLNLNAPRPLLLEAQQQIAKRIQAEPENLFYYQLGEDLAEELQDFDTMRHLERLQLAVAPERRTLLVQNLFLDAAGRGARQEALYLARVLAALPDRHAPEIYRALTRTFIAEKLFAPAEHVVRDADLAEGGNDNLLNLAEVFRQHHHFEEAARLYREVLLLTPDRIDLLQKYAAMLEFQGHYHEAAQINLKALTLTIASLHVMPGIGSARGTAQAESLRLIAQLTHAFANQAVFHAAEYQAQLRELAAQAPNSVQQRQWHDVSERIRLLSGEVAPEMAEERSAARRRPEQPAAGEAAATLRDLPPEEAVRYTAELFAALPPERRENYWSQLVAALDFDPVPELAGQLAREMEQFEYKKSGYNRWQLPCAVALKRAYAEKCLAAQPDSLDASAFAARMRHLDGKAEFARMLAEMIYDEVETRTEYAIPDVRLLQELNRLYADGAGEPEGTGRNALLERIAEREAQLELSGATPGRLLVLGILYDGSGDSDKAFDALGAAWGANRNDYAVFWAFTDAAKHSARWPEWAALLLQQPPTDPTALTLYQMQLLPVLRTLEQWQPAEALLEKLNPAQRARERLFLAMAQGDRERQRAEFMEFVRQAREQQSTLSLFPTTPVADGMQGWFAEKRRFQNNRFAEMANRLPECRGYLEYLFAGSAPGEFTFAPLWLSLQATPAVTLPVPTLGGLFLRAAQPETLTVQEKELLLNWAESGRLPTELAVTILQSVESDRAAVIAEKLLPRQLTPRFDAGETRALLRLLPEGKRMALGAQLGETADFGGRDDVEGELLLLLKEFAPESFRARLRRNRYSADSSLRWLLGVSARNFLLNSEAFPDWQRLSALCETPEQATRMVTDFAEELEQLTERGYIGSDQAVRHYALLAVGDTPSRRAAWLARAQAHHRQPDEATLWLIDALRFNGEEREAARLEQELEGMNKYHRMDNIKK